MDKQVVYISGKMRGLDEQTSRQIFADAKKKLEEQGFSAINPWDLADEKMKAGYEDWGDFVLFDLSVLKKCDKIYMLHNWEDSDGANTEYNYAKGLRIEILYEESQQPLEQIRHSFEQQQDLVVFGAFYDRKNKKMLVHHQGDDKIIEKMIVRASTTNNYFASMLRSISYLFSSKIPSNPFGSDFFDVFNRFK